MSRQAQAEREKEARVIFGSAEAAIAQKFVEAADTYASNAAALHLRAMNIIYETTKERGATILMPTSMVDSMSVALPAAMLAQKDLGGKAAASSGEQGLDQPQNRKAEHGIQADGEFAQPVRRLVAIAEHASTR